MIVQGTQKIILKVLGQAGFLRYGSTVGQNIVLINNSGTAWPTYRPYILI